MNWTHGDQSRILTHGFSSSTMRSEQTLSAFRYINIKTTPKMQKNTKNFQFFEQNHALLEQFHKMFSLIKELLKLNDNTNSFEKDMFSKRNLVIIVFVGVKITRIQQHNFWLLSIH